MNQDNVSEWLDKFIVGPLNLIQLLLFHLGIHL